MSVLEDKYNHMEMNVSSLTNLTQDSIGTLALDASTSFQTTKLLNIPQEELDKMCEFCSNKIKCELSKQKPVDAKITLVPSGQNMFVPKLQCNYL